jgi:hypothetical protein
MVLLQSVPHFLMLLMKKRMRMRKCWELILGLEEQWMKPQSKLKRKKQWVLQPPLLVAFVLDLDLMMMKKEEQQVGLDLEVDLGVGQQRKEEEQVWEQSQEGNQDWCPCSCGGTFCGFSRDQRH